MKHRIERLARTAAEDRSGSAAVEFALVSPMLLIALAGVMVYGLYFGAASSVQQIAADAARASVAGLSDAERSELAREHVARTSSAYVLIDPRKTSVAAGPSAHDARIFQVSVSYDASHLGVWVFDGLIPMPSKTIVRVAAIKHGGY